MLDIVLFEPEIPPNTGNIMRLCANTGSKLHLIEPIGFSMQDKRLRRAGLDYKDWADTVIYSSFDEFIRLAKPSRLIALTTKGAVLLDKFLFQQQDFLIFGPETRGLPQTVFDHIPDTQHVRVPMRSGSRSLNLSNAVAIVSYEAWRQFGFEGAV